MSYLYWFLMGVICLGLPVLAIISGTRDKRRLNEDPQKKTRYYQETVLFLLLMGLSVLGAMAWEGDNLTRIGLSFLTDWRWLVALLAIVFVIWMVLQRIRITPEKAEDLVKHFRPIEWLLPFTPKQLNWTLVMSLFAGTMEEVVYRGFLFEQLSLLMPWVVALLLANGVFAVMHFATGSRNMINTFVLGLIFSGAYLLTKSLWLSMVLHIAVDLYSMTLSYKVYQQINKGSLKSDP